MYQSSVAELVVSSLDGVLILQEGFTFPHVIRAVERSEQVWWVSLACLFFPRPFRVKSDLCIMEKVWKTAVLSTAHGAEGSGAQMWLAWLCFLGNLLFKGCLSGF